MTAPRPTRSPRSPRPAAQRLDRSGLFAWFVVVFGLLSAVALVVYGILRGGGDTHAEWLRLSEELKKQGEPLYFADVKPADVPPEQNFFEAEIFAGLGEGAPKNPLLRLAANPGNGLAVGELLASTAQGNGASLDAIADAMRKAGLVRSKTDFLLAGDRVRAGMRALGLDFSPLYEAADRPAARFPADYSRPFPPLPHLTYLEALGDWLAIRAIAQLSTNDADAASHDLLLIARLADSLAAEPFLASQRTRRLLLGLFAGCVRVGIDWGAWSEEQLAQFGGTLSRAQPLSDFAWAVRGERAQLNSVINTALSGNKPAASERLQEWLGPDLAQLDVRRLRARQVLVNESLQHFLDALTPPQPANLLPGGEVKLPEATGERLKSLVEDARIFAQVQTYLAQAETACALERYRLAKGSYPDKLDELVPAWIEAVPADPVGGKGFGYSQIPGGGFQLAGEGWENGRPWTWTRTR